LSCKAIGSENDKSLGLPVSGTGVRKKDWVLTERAFAKLLAFLDPDRERAAEKYEELRKRLVTICRWRRCPSPEKLADETFDRLSRRLDEGEQVQASDPAAYLYGVARNVLKEYWIRQQLERTAGQAHAALRPEADEAAELDQREHSQRLDCLDRCLDELPPEDLDLIMRYYSFEPTRKIAERSELAASLGISVGALRTRVHRLRRSLEVCVNGCLKKRANA
jgi:RNA polymerase sigma factor (sigma-70 family)